MTATFAGQHANGFLTVNPPKDIRIGNTPAEFAAQCVELLDDAEIRRHLLWRDLRDQLVNVHVTRFCGSHQVEGEAKPGDREYASSDLMANSSQRCIVTPRDIDRIIRRAARHPAERDARNPA